MALVKDNKMSIGNLLKSILVFIVVLIILILASLTALVWHDRKVDYDISSEGLVIPAFTEQTIDFVPSYDKTQTLPFTASAIIDIDNDGIEEVFLGGGMEQADAFYRFTGGEFQDITVDTAWDKTFPDKTFSSVSLDVDANGDTDLIVTRQSGVWLYKNSGGTFTGEKLSLDLDAETVPLSVGVSDLNRDGHFDLFVAGYIARQFVEGETIFNQPYGGVSELFINNGDNTFEKITKQANMTYQHNTFLGVFIDVDNDLQEDLIVAHDTGQIRTWKNNGDLSFSNIPNPSSDSFAYPMGIGVTDLGNDGLPDFWFSNVGSTTPDFLVRGDLRDDQVLNTNWFMFKNHGNFEFEDVAPDVALANYEFSWGAVFEDFNLDGRDDLVVSENYIGWPLHGLKAWRLDGRFLLQTESGQFSEVSDKVNVVNREYGITPLVADFNQDGYPDLIHVNLLGPQKVFLSEAGAQGYLKVKLPDVVQSIGAKVKVDLDDGSTLYQYFVIGEGLVSDQTPIMTFGLNDATATTITVQRLDGSTRQQTGEFRNTLIDMN